MSHHSEDDPPPPPDPSQDLSKNWPLFEPLVQLARTVYQRGNTTIETISGIPRNENETQTAKGTSQTASPATSSAKSIREQAHVAQESLESKHEVQRLVGDSKSEACNPGDSTTRDSARQDVDDTSSRNHTEETAIPSANHAISASTPSLVWETDTTQFAATPPATTQLSVTQSATTQFATESLIDIKADRGQDVQKEFVENEKQEKRGSVFHGQEYRARKPKTSLMKAHKSKRASATSSEDISRILIGGLILPDELCQGENQVGDARVPDCLSDLVDKNSDGRVDLVEEEACQGVHSMDEERQRDAMNVGEPAITPPAPVDDTLMGLTLVDLMLDPVKNSLPSFLCHEEGYPMGITITSKSLEIPATDPDPSPMTSTSSSDVRMHRPRSTDSICTESLLRRKTKASSGTDASCEHGAKFLKATMARDFKNDKTCNSSSWSLVLGVVRRAMKDNKEVIGDHERNEELEDSTCKVGYWGKSIAHGTERFLEVVSDKPVMAVSERTGAPVWGGFWKDIEFWPGDLMSTLPPLGQTTENSSVTRRHWLEGCSVFWSEREMEAFRITFGHAEAGPVCGIPMDIWVNDLDREAVRAKYLSFLH
ncbi:hypothetical protein N7G274_008544 [Stereocaulon virgatum]|uniref:Uncharacterized protein n=1 Tax=Stereocaulon virgatum TaxID=373712 RepID=A0ABR4A0H7_9LECA